MSFLVCVYEPIGGLEFEPMNKQLMRPVFFSHNEMPPERSQEQFLAILSNWEGVLLRIEFFLIYKKWIPSFVFFACVQGIFW